MLTNANVIANILTNANVIINTFSNVSNTTSNVANVTGNITLGTGLNPGYIQPTAFYKTNDPVQSQFYWGQHGYQYGPTFNQQQYNQVAAPETPYGLQQGFKPLTSEQISAIVQGREPVMAPIAPAATRIEQYRPDNRIPPESGQIRLTPNYKPSNVSGPVMPNDIATPTGSYDDVNNKLGEDWSYRMQQAAAVGDWKTYYAIQQQVNDILYPPKKIV